MSSLEPEWFLIALLDRFASLRPTVHATPLNTLSCSWITWFVALCTEVITANRVFLFLSPPNVAGSDSILTTIVSGRLITGDERVTGEPPVEEEPFSPVTAPPKLSCRVREGSMFMSFSNVRPTSMKAARR